MSDPRYSDRAPRYDADKVPPRYDNAPPVTRVPLDRDPSYTGWIIGGLVAVVLVGLVIFGMSDRPQTASSPAPATTGQSTRPPVAPAPEANPTQNPAPAPQPSTNP